MEERNYWHELEDVAPGLAMQYYAAWRLTMILWRDLWRQARVDWSRYRREIWNIFEERLQSAARTSAELDAFLSRFARLMSLAGIGSNAADRAEVARLLAMPPADRRALVRQLREEAPIVVALLRRWHDTKDQNQPEEEL